MRQPGKPVEIGDEAAMHAYAGAVALRWRDAGCMPLLIGLKGDLGAGKTSWVRAALRALGHEGRVPSPTYMLLEHYALEPGRLVVVHADLYRLASEDELENIGLRDWLADADTWLFVEWPERAPSLEAGCDLVLELGFAAGQGRRLRWRAGSAAGRAAFGRISDLDSS